MQVAVNADVYASSRVNVFFPAHNQTPADGNLTGQCVTLVKWFMAEMSDVPNPFAARGHARYLGDNLVAQGLADRVPAGQQKRGDIVCYIYGEYGHTGVLLSGNRLFQQNANVSGVQRRVLSDGTVVYSSSVVALYPSLGGVAPKFYRLKSYKEGSMATLIDEEGVRILAVGVLNRPEPLTTTPDLKGHVGGDALAKIKEFWYSPEGRAANAWQQAAPKLIADQAAALANLNEQVKLLSERPTKAQLEEVQKAAIEANAAKDAAEKALADLKQQVIKDEETGNSFLRWLGNQLNKLVGKG